jgi:hypothetical protein
MKDTLDAPPQKSSLVKSDASKGGEGKGRGTETEKGEEGPAGEQRKR